MAAARKLARIIAPSILIALAIVFVFATASRHAAAHTPITSKYDYNKDVFPRMRDHCGSCHVPGGAGPMSLVTYKAAMPWAQSIRDELTAGRMPPWPIDPTSPAIRGGFPISSRDIDVLVVWASGGTPEGDFNVKLPEVGFHPQWKLGPPDLKIPMDADHSVASNAMEDVSEFSLPLNLTDTKWIKAADLMPGNSTIVRDAVISVDNGPVLALWQPGGDVVPAPSGAAFRITPGAKLHLQIHYKKHFDQEQAALSDRSTVGLYFTDPPPSGHELESVAFDGPKTGTPPNAAADFGGALPRAARIVALRPMLDRAYTSVEVEATTPSGAILPLLRLHGPRPQWFQRYWLQDPVELPAGAKITVRITPLADYSDEPPANRRFPLQLVLDYVPL